MKVPLLPLYIDCFTGIGETDANTLFCLSHFHTDHMKGLSDSWRGGPILCTAVTEQLLSLRFPSLTSRLIALPFWQRTLLFSEESTTSRTVITADDDTEAREVYMTFVPSFHIPGSAMIYLETPWGTMLHTGDFKFEEGPAREVLEPFFAAHRVEHLYLDDTWLHLGFEEGVAGTPGGGANSGTKVLSKMLDTFQVEEAVEAIGRRMDLRQIQFQSQPVKESAFPYKLRVYLHNQFGKETIVQKLARRLCTRILLDDERYQRLVSVFVALQAEDLEDLPAYRYAQRWAEMGGERGQFDLDLDCFISHTQYQALLDSFGGATITAHDAVMHRLPLIEVVGSRAKIATPALEEAARAEHGVPHYGLVMSGWARMQKQSNCGVWQMPTTLHCTPQEIIDFVCQLRPKSVTPLHYRASRSTCIMQRLGPFLRTPYVNQHGVLGVAAQQASSCCWRVSETLLVNGITGEPRATAYAAVTPAHLLGFHVHPQPSTNTKDELEEAVGQPLWPTWKLELLCDRFLASKKRERSDSPSPVY